MCCLLIVYENDPCRNLNIKLVVFTRMHYSVVGAQGGMPGAQRLRDSKVLIDMLKAQQTASKLHAAICATPAVALEPHGECVLLDRQPKMVHHV